MENTPTDYENLNRVHHELHGFGQYIADIMIDQVPYCLIRFDETHVCEWVGLRQLIFLDLPF